MRQLLEILAELEDERIPPLAREVLQLLVAHLRDLADKLAELDRRLVTMARTDETCRSLAEVPGVGPVIATAFAATVPDARAFRSGRHLAAWSGSSPASAAPAARSACSGSASAATATSGAS